MRVKGICAASCANSESKSITVEVFRLSFAEQAVFGSILTVRPGWLILRRLVRNSLHPFGDVSQLTVLNFSSQALRHHFLQVALSQPRGKASDYQHNKKSEDVGVHDSISFVRTFRWRKDQPREFNSDSARGLCLVRLRAC